MVLQVGRFLEVRQLPWLPRTHASHGLRLSPVQPVARVPGTSWEPRRHTLGWPRLVDHRDLQAWLAAELAPAEAVYHLGRLAEARATDERLDLLGFAALVRSDARVPRITSCGHYRGGWLGSGCVALRQVTVGPGHVLYIARRRATAPSPAELAPRREHAATGLIRRAG